jgi:hypothetical protein
MPPDDASDPAGHHEDALADRAEAEFLRLLEEGGLPAPDEVRREEPGEILFLFHEHKLAVVLDYAGGALSAKPGAPDQPGAPAADPRSRPRRPSTPWPLPAGRG